MVKKEVYEEYFFNASPSMFTLNIGGFIAKYDGIDIAGNSIYPLYDKDDKETDKKIVELEQFLLEKDIMPTYRIVYQDNYEKLDRLLFNHHYEKVKQSVVLACVLQGKKNELFRFANFNENGVFIESGIVANDDFLIDYFAIRDLSESQINIFNNAISLTPLEKIGAVLVEERKLIGQAYLVRQGDIVIIKDIVVQEKYRKLGYASKLVYSILTYCLKANVEIVMAEIPLDNKEVTYLFSSNTMFTPLYDIFYRQYSPKTKGRFVFD